MTTENETNVVVTHALENPRNLGMAVKVGTAFTAIQTRVIGDFLRALRHALVTRCGRGWAVTDEWSSTPVDADCYIDISRKPWADAASVGLYCCKKNARGIQFFVYLDPKALRRGAEIRRTLKAVLDERFGHGGRGVLNPWWRDAESPYHQNWDCEGALVALYSTADTAKLYATRIVEIAETASPYVNRLVKLV